jgi:hypothetical protein
MPTLDIFDIEPILHRRGLQRTNLHVIISHIFTFFFHLSSSSSDSEETTKALEGEAGDFNPLLPVFITGLIGLIFPRKVPSSAVSLLLHTMFLAKGLATG